MAGTKQLGKYEILEELGKGGFATVYRAVDTTLERQVALKVLDPLLMRDPAWVVRFQREARAVARLKHPNIVTVYEIGEAEGMLYIAMELVDGPSLKDRIAQGGRLSWDETVGIVSQVADALDYAHGEGVLHRDLKPGNILLDPRRGAVLSDFGFAKLVGESSMSVSISGGVVGTPTYIAPETWDGEEATPQTDLYALGCIVYEMLTGDTLFGGDTPSVVMRKHLLDGPRLPERWPEGVPGEASLVLDRALNREPDKRFESLSAFEDALRATAAGAEPSGSSVAPPTGMVKRRWPAWAWVSAGVVIVAVIATLAFVLWPDGGQPDVADLATSSPTITPSMTASLTATVLNETPTQTPSPTRTPTTTPTPTDTATSTLTATASATASSTPSATHSPTPRPSTAPSPTPNRVDSATPASPEKRLDIVQVSWRQLLYVTDLATNSKVEIFRAWADTSIGYAAWAPSGKRVLISYDTRDKVSECCVYLISKNPDGTDARTIFRTSPTGNLDKGIWSPDGSRIAMWYGYGSDYGVFIMNADGTGLRRLDGSSISDHPYYWSVDGEWIIVMDVSREEFFALEIEGTRRIPWAEFDNLEAYDERYYPWKVVSQ